MASAAKFVPPSRSLRALEEAAQTCRGCEPYKDATQAVFGAGRKSAELMLVGEQPGTRRTWRESRSPLAPVAAVAIHPSAILRLREHDEREAEFAAFVADLEGVASALRGAAR